MADDTINTTIKVKLKPWTAPNFAVRSKLDGADGPNGIPLSDLDDEALEDLCLAYVREVYRKAGRCHCPFYKPARSK